MATDEWWSEWSEIRFLLWCLKKETGVEEGSQELRKLREEFCRLPNNRKFMERWDVPEA